MAGNIVRTIQGAAALAALAFVAGPVALAAGPAPVAGSEAAAPERPLKELRKDLKKTEDRFRSLYNELNRDSAQRIQCTDDASTGSRFKKRSCTTAAMQAATADQMRESLAAMSLDGDMARQSAAGGALEATGPVVASPQVNVPRTQTQGSVVNVNPQRDAFEQNVQKLMAEHPQLRQRYEEYMLARQRLDAAEGRGVTPGAAQAGAAQR